MTPPFQSPAPGLEVPTAFVSTGHLPLPEEVNALVKDAHARYRSNGDGAVSQVYPALARVQPDQFGICLVAASGRVYAAGDVTAPFTIMSVSKPFAFALVCEAIGVTAARERIGANSTGRPFNSLAAIDASLDGRTNPMVNPGAIVTTSLVPGATPDEQWTVIHDGFARFAGRPLDLNEEVYASASATNHRNRGMAAVLYGMDRLGSDPAVATDLYTRQCSLDVTATDIAVMGATLANGGVNPVTGVRAVGPAACHATLAVMATAGLYETSGDWLYEVGLPGKSGIGGGIVTVSPGKGGLGTFAPRLDRFGNSVKGQLVARHLSQGLGMDLFVARTGPQAGPG